MYILNLGLFSRILKGYWSCKTVMDRWVRLLEGSSRKVENSFLLEVDLQQFEGIIRILILPHRSLEQTFTALLCFFFFSKKPSGISV